MDHEYYERKIKELSDTENISFLKTLVKFKKKQEIDNFDNQKSKQNNQFKTEKKKINENFDFLFESQDNFRTVPSNNILDNFNEINVNKKVLNEHSISSIDFLEEAPSNSQFREFQNLDIYSNRGINYQEIFKKNKEMKLNKKKRKKIEQFNTKDTISKIDAIINETKKDEQKLLIRPFSQNTLNSKFGIFDYLLPTKSNENILEKKQKNENINKFKEKRKEIIEKRKKKTYLEEAKLKNHSHISSVDSKISRNIKKIIHHPYENSFKPNSSLTKYPFKQKYSYTHNSKNNTLNKTENEKDFFINSRKNIKKIEIVRNVFSNSNKSLSDKKPMLNKYNRGNKIKSITLKLVSPLTLNSSKS